MTDRVPGAPGRCKAIITEAERTKMLAGEEFTITLTRDDAPVTEGTPLNKENLLPDSLATVLCPGALDPSPADALAAVMPKSVYDADDDGIVDNAAALGGSAAAAYMMKSGGAFTDDVTAYTTNRTTFSLRNTAVYDKAGTTLQSTNSIELWRK